MAALQAERMVRTRATGATLLVESYHDRIRQAAVRLLPPESLQRVHRRLARAYQSLGDTDPIVLVEHWRAAGEAGRAGRFAYEAARRAEAALAFAQAVEYYRLTLEVHEQSPEEKQVILTRLGGALTNSGNLGQAATVYLEAARQAPAGEALELKRLALEQLLRSGRLDEGLELAHEVAQAVGLAIPRSRTAALAGVVLRRAWLAIRGLGFTARPGAASPEELQRLDVCWSLTSGLSLVDPALGTAFQMRFLSGTLSAGETYRASLALSLEIGFRALAGAEAVPAIEQLVARNRLMAELSGVEASGGMAIGMAGMGRILSGDFQVGCDRMTEGERIMRETSSGFRWHIDVCQLYRTGAMIYLGRFAELMRLVPAALEEAATQGDEYLNNGIRTGRSNATWLAADDPVLARRNALAVEPPSPTGRFHLQHYHQLMSLGRIDIYEGHPGEATHRFERYWPAVRESMLLRVQSVRIESTSLRVRARLAEAATAAPADIERHVTHAERLLRPLSKERAAWGDALACLGRASIAAFRDDAERAARLLYEASARCRAVDMRLFALAADHRRGGLVGGDEGAQLQSNALTGFREQQVAAPLRMIALYVPFPTLAG